MKSVPNFQNILVMRGGALGDFILTLPALAALRQHFPQARLEILGYPRIAALAQAGGLADAVGSIEAPDLARWFAPDAPATPRFAAVDLILSYLHDPDKVFQTNLRRAAPQALFLAGPHRPNETNNVHATEALLAPLRELGIQDADPQPRLSLSSETPHADWLALHPGSGSESKNWPESNWSQLLARIVSKTPWHVLLIGGEAEGDRLSRLAPAPNARIHLAQNLPLIELARRLQTCACFLGHDSGVTHLAAALGLPGLVLWGQTNEAVWRPRSPKMKILRHPAGLTQLPVETVFQGIIKEILSKKTRLSSKKPQNRPN